MHIRVLPFVEYTLVACDACSMLPKILPVAHQAAAKSNMAQDHFIDRIGVLLLIMG